MTERVEEKPAVYPPPHEKYEDVIVDPKLFRETLEKLHHKLGTKFMIPTVGGKELDLHKLFVEVTARGGIEKVIKDRRWKEITAGFSFPSTATNASFVLRKYYLSLLQHYEQIYFLNFEVTPGTVAASRSEIQVDKSYEALVPAENSVGGTKRKRNIGEVLPGVLPAHQQFPVSGVIDGKFEHGYFVTVWKDGQKMQGVLYHVHDSTPAQAVQPVGTNVTGTHRRLRRRKLSKLDPTHPKPNRSGYNFFFAEQHARLKPLHPGKDREISRMIGDLWNNLSETNKAVYQEIGLKDKERYKSEMVIYREKQRTAGQTVSTALPIRQILPADDKTSISENLLKQKAEEGNSLSSPETESCSSTGSDSETEEASAAVETGLDSSANIVEEANDEVTVKMTGEEIDEFELRKREEEKMEIEGTRQKDSELKPDGPGAEDVEIKSQEEPPNEPVKDDAAEVHC